MEITRWEGVVEGRGVPEPGNSMCKGPVPGEGYARSQAMLASPWCEMPEAQQCKGHGTRTCGLGPEQAAEPSAGGQGEAAPSHALPVLGAPG